MKKVLFIVCYSFYVVLLLGMLLHTSAHPQLFGKYTLKYFVLVVLFALSIVPFKLLFDYVACDSKILYRKKKLLFRSIHKLLLVALLIVLLVLPLEIYLRTKYSNYESVNYVYTAENFHPFLQSQIATHENLTVNSLGFRGEEIDQKKSANTFRIVVLGGSTVLNREVEFEKNAVRLLEKKLRHTFQQKKIEVINAGKDFYTSEHSIIQYMFKIKDLDPDLVIMWHGVNDMNMSCLLEGVATYGEYKSDYSHMFGAVSAIMFDYFRPQPIVQVKIVSIDFLTKMLKDSLYSDIVGILKERSRDVQALNYLNEMNTVYINKYPSIYAYKRNLEYLVEILKSQEVPFILANQPNLLKEKNSIEEVKAIMFPRLACQENGKYFSLKSLQYGYNLFNSTTEKVAGESKTYFVDLDSIVPKNLNFFFDQVHFTEKGNEVIASELFKFIVANQFIQ